MWQYDFHLFYMGGKAVLAGVSPYLMWDFNGPYPLAVLFVPFSLLPEQISYGAFVFLNIYLLWKTMGGFRIIWPLLSFPVLFCLFVGQIDVLIAFTILLGYPWTLPLVFVKPQVGFVVLPWFLRRVNLRDLIKILLSSILFLGLCFLLRPTWFLEWRSGQPDLQSFSIHASNLYWLIPTKFIKLRVILTVIFSALMFIAVFIIKKRQDSWVILHLFAPLTNIYSTSILAEWISPVEVILSWIAVIVVGGRIHTGIPLFLVGLCILIRQQLAQRKLLKIKIFSFLPGRGNL